MLDVVYVRLLTSICRSWKKSTDHEFLNSNTNYNEKRKQYVMPINNTY